MVRVVSVINGFEGVELLFEEFSFNESRKDVKVFRIVTIVTIST
jgi:hypothetical protein